MLFAEFGFCLQFFLATNPNKSFINRGHDSGDDENENDECSALTSYPAVIRV